MGFKLPSKASVEIDESKITLNIDPYDKALHGTLMKSIRNSIEGVSKGFFREINISGVGYKVLMDQNRLKFELGFSHEVFLDLFLEVKVKIESPTKISLSSARLRFLGIL